MQAAIGVEQLKKFPEFIQARRNNWEYLRKELDCLSDVLILPEPEKQSHPSWFGFLVTVKPESGISRNHVTSYLEKHNVQTRLLFSGNIVKHPCFDEFRETNAYRVVGNLEVSDTITNHTFWIGVYPGMTKEKLNYMIQTIKEAVAR